MKLFASLSVAAAALLISNASFADTLNYPGDPVVLSANTSAQVRAEAATAKATPDFLFGEVNAQPTLSTVSREEVRKEAREFARTHKRDINELG